MPLKFRCYRCNQLMGVSRSKAGEVVSCPKCGTALVVPGPDESPASAVKSIKSSASAQSPVISEEVESIFDIRPEDIRVEPGVPPLPSPMAEAEGSTSPLDPVPESVAPASAEPEPGQEPLILELTAFAPPSSTPPPTAAREAEEPRIQVAASPSIRESEGSVRVRSRDVILPRSVVLTWSLFVLMALAFSFGAGLLAGHYVWRVHEPLSRLGSAPNAR